MIARAVMGERLVPIVFFSPIRVEYELVQKMCWLVAACGLHLSDLSRIFQSTDDADD